MTEKKEKKSGLQKLRETVEAWQSIIVGIASIGALVFAFLSNDKATSNATAINNTSEKIDSTNDDIKELKENIYALSENIAKEFSIDNIVPTSVQGVYRLSGRYEGLTSDFKGKKLLALVNQGNSFWRMRGDVILESDGDWFHNNAVINLNDGDYKLLLGICDESSTYLLDQLGRDDMFTGKPGIIQVINSETLVKSGDDIKIKK